MYIAGCIAEWPCSRPSPRRCGGGCKPGHRVHHGDSRDASWSGAGTGTSRRGAYALFTSRELGACEAHQPVEDPHHLGEGRCGRRGGLGPVAAALVGALRGGAERGGRAGLKTKNGRKNVKSARYRPILSASRRRQRPTHVYARENPTQNGQNGGNWAGK